MRPRARNQLALNVHMAWGHDKLKQLLREQHQIDLDELRPGELVLCVNRRWDRMKAIGFKGLVLAYLKMPAGQKIMGEALRYIPRTFGAGGFNYDAAVQRALADRLGPRLVARPPTGPLAEARLRQQAGL